MESTPDPILVFILSYERPLYLWASLDSLYRNTKYPCRFILADNCSQDPLVQKVIGGFDRRGMFHDVYLCEDNRLDRIEWMVERHRDLLGQYWAFCECDVVVAPGEPCWLQRFVQHMAANPRLGMLGSYIDSSDFVSPEAARRLHPGKSVEELGQVIKLQSPERAIDDVPKAPIISPFNPPGRLLMIRTETLDTVPIRRDSLWHQGMLRSGYETGIATDVVHRHLSLLNIYDYADYDMELRDSFFGIPPRQP